MEKKTMAKLAGTALLFVLAGVAAEWAGLLEAACEGVLNPPSE